MDLQKRRTQYPAGRIVIELIRAKGFWIWLTILSLACVNAAVALLER